MLYPVRRHSTRKCPESSEVRFHYPSKKALPCAESQWRDGIWKHTKIEYVSFWFSLDYPWFFFLYPCSQKWILCIPDSINQAHLEVLKSHSSIWEHTVCRWNFIFCRKTSTPLPIALFFHSTLSWVVHEILLGGNVVLHTFLLPFFVGIQYATDQLCLLQESISTAKRVEGHGAVCVGCVDGKHWANFIPMK